MEMMMRMINPRRKEKGVHKDHYMEDDEPKKRKEIQIGYLRVSNMVSFEGGN